MTCAQSFFDNCVAEKLARYQKESVHHGFLTDSNPNTIKEHFLDLVASNFESYMNTWGVKTFGSQYRETLGLSDQFSAGLRSMSIGKTTQFLIDPN